MRRRRPTGVFRRTRQRALLVAEIPVTHLPRTIGVERDLQWRPRFSLPDIDVAIPTRLADGSYFVINFIL